MNLAEISLLLNAQADPASAALSWWQSTPAPRTDSSRLLAQLFGASSDPMDAAAIRAIVLAGKAWSETEPQRATELAVELAQSRAGRSQCLAAALTERTSALQAAKIYSALAYSLKGEGRASLLVQAAKVASEAPRRAAWLKDAATATGTLRTANAIDALVQKIGREGSLPVRRGCRIALVGTVTMDLLAPAVRAACFSRGIKAETWVGGFGQHAQEILGTDSVLSQWKPDIVAILVDWRSLGLSEDTADSAGWVEATARELAALWRAAAERLKAHVIQFGFETAFPSAHGEFSSVSPTGRTHLLRALNERLRDLQADHAGVTILDLDRVAGEVGAKAWRNEALWFAARQYPAPDALVPLANRLASQVQASLGLAAKCLALDLDGTLWGGIVGEDGANGIVIGGNGAGEAFAEFQRFVRSLRQRGIFVAVCSKNNEVDAKAPFLSNREMVLGLDDIDVFVANWEPKDANLRQIAATLNIGLDAVVFADDNPVECRWVAERLPEVEVIELGVDPASFVAEIDHRQPFEAFRLSAEDRIRAVSSSQEKQRVELRASAGSVEEFVAGLGIQVQFEPLDAANVGRVAQLINKTNQFNLTTRRTTEGEISSLVGSLNQIVLLARVSDRFGDYGLTGVLVAEDDGKDLTIETWLISCRVLGRNVEQAMIAELVQRGRAKGPRRLIGRFVPSEKNANVRDLYPKLGFSALDAIGNYSLDLAGPLPTVPQGILIRH